MKNKLSDLRNHLFETLEALKDEEKPMDMERARAVTEVAHAIINSAKVELRAIEVLGREDEAGDFFLGPRVRPDPPKLLLQKR